LKAALPEEWDPLQSHGHAIAGTPSQVRDYIAAQAEAAGATYFVCDFAFGSISHAEVMRSVELFAQEVMPVFADA
ncbi:MAG TPA: LLM class flavin-dependent oxidoreductase, partial [Stellaceae bacterium]|nr:LLM class flavin-dependent oxidoreductase [Stellaceae bacterium]